MNDLSSGNVSDGLLLLKAGSVIFVQGKPSKYLYLVKKGEVRMVKFKGHGLHVTQVCGEKEILNEVAILTKKPNDLTAFAKTDVELVLVDQNDIFSAFKDSPEWVPNIFETLCERLKQTQSMIDEHNLDQDKDPRLQLSKEDEGNYLIALDNFNSND